MAVIAPVPEFRLALPVAWVELDLDPATRLESIARIVAERGRAGSEIGLTHEQQIGLLSGLAEQAAAKNGVYAAFYSEVLEGAPVSASLVISIVPAGAGPPPVGSDALSVARVVRAMFPPELDAEVQPLAAGPAVRVRRRLEAPLLGVRPIAIENLQYLVVLPDLTGLALLDFSTPTVGLADGFVELFDAIAGTLVWT